MNQHKPLFPVDPKGLDKIARELLEKEPETHTHSNIGVEGNNDFWRIAGVQYRGGIHTVDLMKKLLKDGASNTQTDWASHYETARQNGEFHTPDYPLFYGALRALYSARDDGTQAEEIEKARAFLKSNARARWLMTLTRIKYQPSGLDEVIHNFGTNDQYGGSVDFIGPDEWLKNTSNSEPYQVLLGTQDDIEQINAVYKWLNETDVRIWRLNSKPDSTSERVAGFFAGSGGAGLGCVGVPSDSSVSLGVREARAKN